MIHLGVAPARPHVLNSHRCRVPAHLAWWDGTGIVPACIKKVSRVGATLVTEHQPPDAASLWVRLDGAAPSEWVEARIVAVEASSAFLWIGKSVSLIQVMFPGPHPDQLFQTVFEDITRSAPDP